VSTRQIRPLRYPASCVGCGADLQAKARAAWDRERRQATCEPCVTTAAGSEVVAPVDRGRPGGSALREGERRQERREARINKAHPRLGKAILALTDEPQSTRSWQSGGKAERELGEALERLREEGFGVLHDRRIPRSRANIDHLVIGPAGVFVIDTKRWAGKIERRDRGWFLDRHWRLYVNGRDKTRLVEAMPRHRRDVVQRPAQANIAWQARDDIPVHQRLGASAWAIEVRRRLDMLLQPTRLRQQLLHLHESFERAHLQESLRARMVAWPLQGLPALLRHGFV